MDAHPIAAVYPLMHSEQMKQLIKSIKDDGLQSPIVRIGDKILDGRCRFAACKIAGVEPEFIDYDGPTDGASLAAFVLAANNYRRHLTPSQLSMAAAKLVFASQGPTGPSGPITQKVAARANGASVRSVKRAARVLKNSPPDVVEAVEHGTVSLADGSDNSAKPKEKQKAAVNDVKSGKAKTMTAAISGGTSFDTDEIDAAPFRPASKPKNGAPTVTTKQRKDCKDLLGKLIRSLSKLGIYDEFVEPLSQIAERLKQI
jgi:ParB-like chromosome segregation protein Spo0J